MFSKSCFSISINESSIIPINSSFLYLFKNIGIIIQKIQDILNKTFSLKEAEKAVIRIAQFGGASGIHLIVSTQRPGSRIISPIIKANFPFRIVLRLADAGDEKVMDCKGTRRLIPPGDALANLKGGLGEDPCAVF